MPDHCSGGPPRPHYFYLSGECGSFHTRGGTHWDNTTDGTVNPTLASAYTWPDKDDCAVNGTTVKEERPADLSGDDRSIDLFDRLML